MTAISTYQSSLDSCRLLAMVNDRYGLGFTRCRFWTHGQNDTYLLEGARGERAMLRVYAHGWRSLADVFGELAFLEHLRSRAVAASGPVRDQEQQCIQRLECAEGPRWAVVFSYAPGLPLQHKDPSDAPTTYGSATGAMHAAASGYSDFAGRFALDPDHLLAQPLKYIESVFTSHRHGIYFREIAARCLRRWSSVRAESSATVFCHGDLHGGNAHVADDGSLTFIDFDCGGMGPIEYDLAAYRRMSILAKRPRLWDQFFDAYCVMTGFRLSQELIDFFAVVRQVWLTGLHCRQADRFGYDNLSDAYMDDVVGYLRETESLIG